MFWSREVNIIVLKWSWAMWRHFPKVWARGEPYGPISGRILWNAEPTNSSIYLEKQHKCSNIVFFSQIELTSTYSDSIQQFPGNCWIESDSITARAVLDAIGWGVLLEQWFYFRISRKLSNRIKVLWGQFYSTISRNLWNIFEKKQFITTKTVQKTV